MPVYEYCCEACGPFDALKPLSEFRSPVACPNCGQSAPRMIGSAPSLSTLSHAMRRAHAMNERSADTPRSTRSGHGMNCGCCSTSSRPGKTRRTADGGKTFLGARPWMISH